MISLLRGDWLGAGTSLVSFIPYIGDAAKLTRIAKYVRSVENAIELAAKSEKYADKLQPALKQLHALLKRVPLEKLPDSVQGPLKTLKGKLDELFEAPSNVTEGIYEFTASSGKTYVGQSGNIPSRIGQHLSSGKLLQSDLPTVRTTEVLGGKTAREVAEQLRINKLGGVRNLENIRNPIAPNRRHLLPP